VCSSDLRNGKSGGWHEVLTDAQVQRIIDAHAPVMQRFGYLDQEGRPLDG